MQLFFKIFFRSSWVQLLFPSVYKPSGDGLSWPTIHDDENEFNKIEDMQIKHNDLEGTGYIFQKCSPRRNETVQN